MNSDKLLVIFILIITLSVIGTNFQFQTKPKIALIIIDGFKPDYFNYTPNLASFVSESQYFVINTVEPSITPTVHASMISCQPPEKHGIINYEQGFLQMPFIFEWAKENGLRTCTAYAKSYLNFLDYADSHYYSDLRNDRILIDKTKEYGDSCEIILVSLPETDLLGHEYGPSSQNMKKFLPELDRNAAELIDYLRAKNIKIILVSDHGMCDSLNGGIHNISEECALKIPLIIDKNLRIPEELDKNNLKLTNIMPIICNYYGFDCTDECHA